MALHFSPCIPSDPSATEEASAPPADLHATLGSAARTEERRMPNIEKLSLQDVAATEVHKGAKRADAVARPGLQVIHISHERSNLERLRNVARTWSKMATAEARQIAKETQERAILYSNSAIHDGIDLVVQKMLRDPEHSVMYHASVCVMPGCDDWQGLMLTENCRDATPPYLYIAYLGTNPNNLVNGKGVLRGMRGAGTCLVEHAKDLARQEGFSSIQLEYTDVAKIFYKQRGFEIQDNRDAIFRMTPP